MSPEINRARYEIPLNRTGQAKASDFANHANHDESDVEAAGVEFIEENGGGPASACAKHQQNKELERIPVILKHSLHASRSCGTA